MVDLTGYRSGKLTALEPTKMREDRHVVWKCLCDCGNICYVNTGKLRSGNKKSCGCLIESHGHCRTDGNTSEYIAWRNMKGRCLNPKDKAYKNYGGRGITVCSRWLNSFKNFLEDMGEKPTPDLTIERINNNDDYKPVNCKWATYLEQAANKRDRKWFCAFNEKTSETHESNNQCEFARQYRLCNVCISRCLRGGQDSHKGWIFNFIEESLCN